MNRHLLYSVVAVLFYLRILLSCAHTNKFTALVLNDNLDDSNKEDEDHDDLEIFHPTNKWQILKPGQSVPPGSHVRLNLQTGQKEAKLGKEKALQNRPSGQGRQADKQTSLGMAQETLKILKDVDVSSTLEKDKWSLGAQFRSVEELKRDMEALHLLVQTDAQIMSKLVFQLNSTNSTVDQRVTALLNLEYLVHQVDNAQNLVSIGGMALIIDAINDTDVRLQESAAYVLGSAVSSNPSVQVVALEHGTLQTLLTLLATPRPMSVKKKVLFALACLLRHFPSAQSQFVKFGGLQVLLELFKGHGADTVCVRIITMLYDLITEKEHLQQYGEVSLFPMLVEQGWCALVPELLVSPDHDRREKALRLLLVMIPHCRMLYMQSSTLRSSLGFLHKQYQELAKQEKNQEETSGYFGEIFVLVNTLVMNMQ